MAFKACERCEANGTPGWLGGVGRLTKCDCLLAYEEKTRIAQRIEDSGLNKNYLDYDIKDYISKSNKPNESLKVINNVISNVDAFVNEGGQLYIWGNRNTQKTSVISYLVRQVAVRNISIYYITMPQMIEALMQAKDYHESDTTAQASSIKRRLEETDLLVVDNAFDPSKIYFSGKSTYKATLLSSLFSYRNEQKCSNIFVANVPRSGIDLDIFGESLPETLNRGCIELEFSDKLNENEMRSDVLKSLMV